MVNKIHLVICDYFSADKILLRSKDQNLYTRIHSKLSGITTSRIIVSFVLQVVTLAALNNHYNTMFQKFCRIIIYMYKHVT